VRVEIWYCSKRLAASSSSLVRAASTASCSENVGWVDHSCLNTSIDGGSDTCSSVSTAPVSLLILAARTIAWCAGPEKSVAARMLENFFMTASFIDNDAKPLGVVR